ncbi:spondin domain-containing protein [Marinibactrum halimedae]|uniref:Spondin domain-containing protein n=1 Tax=Marinibactrum halimedae TaxID=1444977 RepID=A0AA37WKU8_9GAMM|nr:spondin domain-containing protein [Marinibactrum halimedae]MCD9461137.1 spondin domain-containing protein [Marinibactrum halimedae]GLS24635.1 hypothetical protein GCM10007877_03490 [Marinibactrum halimedae]
MLFLSPQTPLHTRRRLLPLVALSLALTLSACGSDDDDDNDTPTPTDPPVVDEPAMVSFSVTVTNATNNQPLSPIAVIAHDGTYTPWAIGSAASEGLAILAESGDPASFVSEASEAFSTATASDVLGPGNSTTIDITFNENDTMALSIATMLVNTNDAFTGIGQVEVSEFEVGDTTQMLAPVYDAGTEENSELAATIPGPAGEGEGNSEGREVNDQVTRHPGVVTSSDGYAESALDESHRFDNGAMRVTIERTM